MQFSPNDCIDIRGSLKRMVQMPKDGFMFFVMGFTGHESARIKEAFIGTFNQMAAFIRIEQRGLLQDLFALHERERASMQRTSAGSQGGETGDAGRAVPADGADPESLFD
ncbi:Rha family transcriptional regulator [Paraburkholderia sediminicola]|nr:Rha family transcriptional regulator [Paraburkholderia sediminicola]